MTPEQAKELAARLKVASDYFYQAAREIEASEPREVWGDSFADGSAAFFYCRQLLGFKTKELKPTMKLRWADYDGEAGQPVSSFRTWDQSWLCQLEQWWEDEDGAGEWRKIKSIV